MKLYCCCCVLTAAWVTTPGSSCQPSWAATAPPACGKRTKLWGGSLETYIWYKVVPTCCVKAWTACCLVLACQAIPTGRAASFAAACATASSFCFFLSSGVSLGASCTLIDNRVIHTGGLSSSTSASFSSLFYYRTEPGSLGCPPA